MSLDGLRKPNIDSWDSMGILGLTSKMWNATSKKQETFMSSTGKTNTHSFFQNLKFLRLCIKEKRKIEFPALGVLWLNWSIENHFC